MSREVWIGLGILGAVVGLGLLAASSVKAPAPVPTPLPEPEKSSPLGGKAPVLQPGTAATAARVFATSPVLMATLQDPNIPQWGKDRIMRVVFGRPA
jgi:hypothetical protein